MRAFSNSCRPFHSWSFGLDGRLAVAPHMMAARGIDKSDYGLIQYAAAECGEFIVAFLAEEPVNLDAQLGEFSAVHSPWPMARLVPVRRREQEFECNWKLFLDTFNEYCHLAFDHPNSIDSIYRAPEAVDRTKGTFATQFRKPKARAVLL
ncbi:MAG: hypothetical protein OXL68_09610 [Paracoccaceae bacterium]|nr:hypothetical protein [Paracoccaceae bacterium]